MQPIPVGTDAHELRIRAGYVLALLLAAVSLGGLLSPSAYARETAGWTTQAIAQDCFDLFVAVPAIAAATWWAAHGSRRGRIVLAGFSLYAVYTLAIYCFAVHFNQLFLVYCAGFGVALYTTITLAARLLCSGDVRASAARIPRRTAGILLVAIGGAFGLLWLAAIIPATLAGTTPAELVETGLFVNPIHVLDLSFVLPLHVIAGVGLLRRRGYAYTLAPGLLAFGALMAASIAVLVVYASGVTPVAIAMGAVALASAWLCAALLEGAGGDDVARG